MEGIPELVTLIKETLIPKFEKLSEIVEKLADNSTTIMLLRERDKGKAERLEDRTERIEEKLSGLKCEDNKNILHGYGARLAKLEERAQEGHKRDEECRKKNKLAGEALTLAQKNEDQNKIQESRYNSIVKWIAGIVAGILILAGYAFFKSHWK